MKVTRQSDNWFRGRRESLGLTQSAMAERCGVDRMSIWTWETSRHSPRATQAAVLAEAYEVDRATIVRQISLHAANRIELQHAVAS